MDRVGGGREMKFFVRMITVIALILVMVGGSALDGKSILFPAAMILPGVAWLGLIALANLNGNE